MGEKPDPVNEGMRILQTRRADGGATDVGDGGPRVKPRGRLLEVLAMIGRPGLLLDEGNAIGVFGHAPAVAVGQPFAVPSALSHERVLRPD